MPELPDGVSTAAERVFIELARESFRGITGFDPDEGGIVIKAEDSDVSLDRMPLITVSCGDLQDYKAGIDRLIDWAPNVEELAVVDQGYVLFSVYSGLAVEARDLADHFKETVIRARQDLGQAGIFGLRQIGVSKPSPIEGGATAGATYNAQVTFAFMVARAQRYVESEASMWNEAMVSINTEIEASEVAAPAPTPTSLTRLRGRLELAFTGPVEPYLPYGAHVEVWSGEAWTSTDLRLERDLYDYTKFRVEGVGLGRHRIRYESGDITGVGYTEDVAAFEIAE